MSETNKSEENSPVDAKGPQPLRVPIHHVESDFVKKGEGELEIPSVPARILNEYVYCPRLAYLMWVQKEWQESSDTLDGSRIHQRVDKTSGSIEDLTKPDGRLKVARSVELSSDKYHLTAKIDLLETADSKAIPVEYKRGKRPHIPKQAYDPERVQLCAQGLLLEDHGYECSEGTIYFAGSKERVRIEFDRELRDLTLRSLEELKQLVNTADIPPPLEDSPKCVRCSLVGICLPDEVNLLNLESQEVRPIQVPRTRKLPIYVQSFRGKISKRGEQLIIDRDDDEPISARLGEVSELVISGNVYVTTPTLQELMKRNIPITWQSHGGWFLGHTVGTGHSNVELRTAQYKLSFDDQQCLRLARGWVSAKIKNCRTLLRRNWSSTVDSQPTLKTLKGYSERALKASNLEVLLGIEGAAATAYFQSFSHMLKQSSGEKFAFQLHNRNRRPPTDPINALLSFGYSMLSRHFLVALSAVGFDAYRGFYHQPRFGRPALALDFMETFRPLIVDSAVITSINNEEINENDFVIHPMGVNMSTHGRKKFIATFERRLSQEITHPIFGYRIEYRRLFLVQARLLGRYLLKEIPDYPHFTTR